GRQYRVKDDFAGRAIKCKQCGAKVVVPAVQESGFAEEEDDWMTVETPPSLPKRKKKPTASGGRPTKSKPGKSKSSSGSTGGGASAGKKMFAVIGMGVGGLIILGGVMGVVNGNMRGIRAVITGCVVIGVCIGWFRGE
ncbi:MAG: hypothetical protein KDA89_07385, partial [Planctomycetaceae bacterium]|nr:hypothetical protein [Planctomycetaceae bacterium]